MVNSAETPIWSGIYLFQGFPWVCGSHAKGLARLIVGVVFLIKHKNPTGIFLCDILKGI